MRHFVQSTVRVPCGVGRWTDVSIAQPRAPESDVPLLLLHGGPGGTNHRFKPLIVSLARKRTVICFDQLNSGRSARAVLGNICVQDFVDQLDAVRSELRLDRMDLLGHSWGGMLALEYLRDCRNTVRSLVLSSTPADMELWTDETARLRADLPHHLGRLLEDREPNDARPTEAPVVRGRIRTRLLAELLRIGWFAATRPATQRISSVWAQRGLFRDPTTAVAELAYLRAHGCVMDWPPICLFEGTVARNKALYEHLWGPDETNGTGPLRYWSMPDSEPLQHIPTLLLRGEFDETTVAHHLAMISRCPNALAAEIPGAAHVAMIEQPQRYAGLVEAFLAGVDNSTVVPAPSEVPADR